MLVVMREDVSEDQVAAVVARLERDQLSVHRSDGGARVVLGVNGTREIDPRTIEMLEGVHEVLQVREPYRLASRSFRAADTVITLASGPAEGLRLGGDEVVVVAGPCSAESRDQVARTAAACHRGGAKLYRGGAFKPRSSPYSFQGLGEEGLAMLRDAAREEGMALVTEVMDAAQIELIERYADILQVGARNMQNFTLLKELGRTRTPVLLKRGISATIEEWLLSAEYILAGGNEQVILCERGIRTFESATRNTLDISAIPVVKQMSHLPVFVDPSHGTGRRDKVAAMARAAVAAGADGLLIEVHHDPDHALSDGPQSLHPAQFEQLMAELRIIAPAIGRSICVETERRSGWGR
jgi:3-deoxy-7-phosphoheptulonate synthase